MGEGGGRRGSGSRWRRGPFPKRPEGFVSLACSDRQPQRVLGPAVGRGARRCEPWSCSVGPRSLARGSVTCCLRSAAHVAEPLRALPGPACAGGDLTPVPGSAVVNGFCTPSDRGGSWRQVGGQRQLSVGGSGGPGRCAGFDPDASRQLVLSPGLVGPGSTIPPRAPRRVAPAGAIAWLRSCNPNARRDDVHMVGTRPVALRDLGALAVGATAAGTRAMNPMDFTSQGHSDQLRCALVDHLPFLAVGETDLARWPRLQPGLSHFSGRGSRPGPPGRRRQQGGCGPRRRSTGHVPLRAGRGRLVQRT